MNSQLNSIVKNIDDTIFSLSLSAFVPIVNYRNHRWLPAASILNHPSALEISRVRRDSLSHIRVPRFIIPRDGIWIKKESNLRAESREWKGDARTGRGGGRATCIERDNSGCADICRRARCKLAGPERSRLGTTAFSPLVSCHRVPSCFFRIKKWR